MLNLQDWKDTAGAILGGTIFFGTNYLIWAVAYDIAHPEKIDARFAKYAKERLDRAARKASMLQSPNP